MTLGPSLSAFVTFFSYRWLFNVAMSFVNGPLLQVTWHSEDSQHQQPGHDAPAVDIRDTNGISSQHLQPGHDAPAVEMDRGTASYWSQPSLAA